jgi:hypothetical protein
MPDSRLVPRALLVGLPVACEPAVISPSSTTLQNPPATRRPAPSGSSTNPILTVTNSLLHSAIFAIPALQIGAGIWLLVRRRRFFRAARSVEGVTLEPVLPSGSDDSCTMRFEYQVAGVRYVRDGNGTATRRAARAGRKVVVYYLEESPERGRLAERAVAFAAVVVIAAGLGIAGMLIAIAMRDGGL